MASWCARFRFPRYEKHSRRAESTRFPAPEEFAAFIRSEIDKYAKVIREANVKLD